MRLFIFLMLVWGSAFAGPQDLCSRDPFEGTCLASLLSYRCGWYAPGDAFALASCRYHASVAATLLELKEVSPNSPGEWIAFPTELSRMLKYQSVQEYLRRLKQKLQDGYRFGDALDLWQFTLDYVAEGYSALRWIAILLQDTSGSKTSLTYLVEKDRTIPRSILNLYSDVLDLLSAESIKNRNATKWLKLYPDTEPNNAEKIFRPNFYHFYTIAYIARYLQNNTQNNHMAAMMALMIEAEYKFKQISPENWPFWHTRQIPSNAANDERVVSIYMGYQAARFGAFATFGHKNPMSFSRFSSSIRQDAYAFMQKLYYATP